MHIRWFPRAMRDAPALRHLDVSNGMVLKGLNVFPNGIYALEIDALSYHTVSRFVSIPPDGNGAVAVTLPVNPKKVLSVDFPAYRALLADGSAVTFTNGSISAPDE